MVALHIQLEGVEFFFAARLILHVDTGDDIFEGAVKEATIRIGTVFLHLLLEYISKLVAELVHVLLVVALLIAPPERKKELMGAYLTLLAIRKHLKARCVTTY